MVHGVPGDLRFDAFRACLVGDNKLRKTGYTPRVPREQNGNHTALNLSYKAAQGVCWTAALLLVARVVQGLTMIAQRAAVHTSVTAVVERLFPVQSNGCG